MPDAAVPQQPQTPNEIYGIFAGPIDQQSVGRLANAAAIATSNNVTHVHLAFQTSGGAVADGVAIYNLFHAFPLPLTLYNIGSIMSAGIIAYLGAPNRLVSLHGTFMIHRTVSPGIGATSERLHAMAKSVILDDTRTENIFIAAKLNINKDQREIHKVADLWLSSDEAVAAGLATAIGEFAPPKRTQLFFLGPV
jgi:ATP-dependent protease ClpP protease subunit